MQCASDQEVEEIEQNYIPLHPTAQCGVQLQFGFHTGQLQNPFIFIFFLAGIIPPVHTDH